MAACPWSQHRRGRDRRLGLSGYSVPPNQWAPGPSATNTWGTVLKVILRPSHTYTLICIYTLTYTLMYARKQGRKTEWEKGRKRWEKRGGQRGEELKPTVRRLGLLSDPTPSGFHKGHLKGRSPSPGAGSNQEFILNWPILATCLSQV